MFDFLIIGAGLFGCTTARLLAEKGYTVNIWEKHDYIGGHCYDEKMNGIMVQRFGPHVFHTSNDEVWSFVNRFAEFNQYKLKVLSKVGDYLYSFPVNFLTLHQLLGVQTPEECEKYIESDKVPNDNPHNLEEYAMSIMGKTLYEMFFKGYTTKQWATDPKNLPKEILGRIPFRYNFNDAYFAKHRNKYEGVPIGGYSKMMKSIVAHPNILVSTGISFNQEHRFSWQNYAKKLIYTGPIDLFFNFELGKLPYRSLSFEYEYHDVKMYQAAGVINYPDVNIPWTRITEHKHMMDNADVLNKTGTIISKEYPANYEKTGEAYYPINLKENNDLYQKYLDLSLSLKNVYFGGRLATYAYNDMDITVENAMKFCEQFECLNH